jgi:hypothetical protein
LQVRVSNITPPSALDIIHGMFCSIILFLDVEYSQPNGRNNKIKMDSYDVHVHPIQLQLYDKEYFCSSSIHDPSIPECF